VSPSPLREGSGERKFFSIFWLKILYFDAFCVIKMPTKKIGGSMGVSNTLTPPLRYATEDRCAYLVEWDRQLEWSAGGCRRRERSRLCCSRPSASRAIEH